MKRVFYFVTVLCAMWPWMASAQTPCSSAGESPQPDEKCKTDLEHIAPVEFHFPVEEAPEAKGEKAQEPEKKSPETPSVRKVPETCTYSAYAWDTRKGRAVDGFRVHKPYGEVTDDERDPNAPECTICQEDQVVIAPRELGINHADIRVCHVFAPQVRQALSDIAASGDFDIEKLEGYRPGRTRGKIDKNGLRTQWSQHSFGTALDINAHRNAIYSNCPGALTSQAAEVSGCRRGIGGDWNPQKYPRTSIVKDGVVYRAMTRFWKWGGEISGQTKDVMHFSVTGY